MTVTMYPNIVDITVEATFETGETLFEHLSMESQLEIDYQNELEDLHYHMDLMYSPRRTTWVRIMFDTKSSVLYQDLRLSAGETLGISIYVTVEDDEAKRITHTYKCRALVPHIYPPPFPMLR